MSKALKQAFNAKPLVTLVALALFVAGSAFAGQALVLRDKSGNIHGDKWQSGAYGEIWIDDATGFVSASTPTAEKVDATPVKVGRLNNVTADAAERAATTGGQLTISRPGDYDVHCSGTVLSGNAAVVTLEIYKAGAVVADAAGKAGGALKNIIKMQGTAATDSFAISGILAGAVKGDTVDLRVTSDVGTVTIKALRCGIKQLSDATLP